MKCKGGYCNEGREAEGPPLHRVVAVVAELAIANCGALNNTTITSSNDAMLSMRANGSVFRVYQVRIEADIGMPNFLIAV